MRHTSPLLLVVLATSQLGADLYVETSGTDTANDCLSASTPCATIEYAAGLAAADDAIQVGAGTFSSTAADYPITLPSGVALIGSGSGMTTIGASTTTLFIASSAQDLTVEGLAIAGTLDNALVLDEHAGDLTLRDLDITVSEEGLDASFDEDTTGTITLDGLILTADQPITLDVDGDGPWVVSLTGSTVTSTGSDYGIQVDVSASTETVLEDAYNFDVEIIGNTFSGSGAGPYLEVSDYANVRALIRDNDITTEETGIRVSIESSNAVDLTIDNNTVSGTPSWAIYLGAYGYNTVIADFADNTLSNATEEGLWFTVSDYSNTIDLTVRGNTVTGGLADGMYMGITDSSYNAFNATISGNTVTGNAGDGLHIANTYEETNVIYADVRGNTFSDNGDNGIYIENTTGAFVGHFHGNVISGNDENGMLISSNEAGTFVKLTHNTIQDNAAGYTDSDYFDIDATDCAYYDIVARDNWWGSTDRAVIDSHLAQAWEDGDEDEGQILYSALAEDLAFSPTAPTVAEEGAGLLALNIDEGAPPFVDSAGINALVVTIGGVDAAVVEVAEDGSFIIVEVPEGSVGSADITVTNPGGQTGTSTVEYVRTLVDADGDGVEDDADNCVDLANIGQVNTDNDSSGDACDDDDDDDTVADADDNCGLIANADQANGDGDDFGDACDDDLDNDGFPNTIDNCDIANSDQVDTDQDGDGDACDDDDDGDGANDDVDNCDIVNADQSDLDDDGIGDACDDDLDNDGIINALDNCSVPNADQADADDDGVGDACDLDADGDGVADLDQVDTEPVDSSAGRCGCATTVTPTAPGLSLMLLGLAAVMRRRRNA